MIIREYASASEMVTSLMAIRKKLLGQAVIPTKPVIVEEVIVEEVIVEEVIVEAEPPPAPKPPLGIEEDMVQRFPTIAEIVNTVSAIWNIAPVHILSGRRTWDCTFPRHVVCALACRLTTRTLPEIGRYIGGRDHTTVLHARNNMQPHMEKVEARLPLNATVRQWAEEMLKEVGTGSVKQRREKS